MPANSTTTVASDYFALVQQLYVAYFGRPADTMGLHNFADQLVGMHAPTTLNAVNAAMNSDVGLKTLVNSFGSSSESTELYGSDPVAFVSAIYNNVLNRMPDYDGLQFWVGEINAGRLSKAMAATAIADGAMARGNDDATILHIKSVIAAKFTDAVDTAVELVGYQGAYAASVARDMLKSITVSTDPDTFDVTHALELIITMCGTYAADLPHLMAAGFDANVPDHQQSIDSLHAGNGAGADQVTLVGHHPLYHDVGALIFA